ncbi:MAG: TonB-linked SusC/RagA family outer membrane protein, partial [Psychroserpens sp.]
MIQKVLKLFSLTCILGFSSLQAQTVNGKITDALDGTPLPGVSVIVKGTSTGVSSDFDGMYSLDVKKSNAILQFSYMGYVAQEVSVNGRTLINIKLEQGAESLDEIVVTALGIKKSTRSLGYSLTEVKGDEMSANRQTNAINALQGKVAGVNITGNATGAGGSSRVIIRGNTSLTGNNQPLYIVDGIPIGNANNGSAGLWGGSDGGDGISSINPDDIASVSVLKGGPAAALYGSRAATGVIIITTKTGKNQKGFGVEYSTSYTFDEVNTNLQDFQTEYGQGALGERPVNTAAAFENGTSSWGEKYDGASTVQWDGVSRPYSYAGSNFDKFYRTGSTRVNSVSISHGDEKINFRFSASDLLAEDVMPNSKVNRKSFSLNLGAVLAEKLKINTSIKHFREKTNNRARLSDAPGNANYTIAALPGNVDVTFMEPGTNEDGSELGYSNNIYSQNPYFAAYNFRNEDQRNRIIASVNLRYDITDWLYAFARTGIDDYTIRGTSVEPWGTAYKVLGGMSEGETRYTQIDSDIMLGFEKDINEKFSTNSFIGASSNSVETENLSQNGNDFIVPGLETISNTQNQGRGQSYSNSKINSLYGSFEVSYNKLAYLTYTMRNDWFSTLSAPGKTTPNNDLYMSLSGSLLLSELFELPEVVNFAKFRAGYSELAGGAPGPYSLGLTYGIFGQGHQGQPLGSISNGSIPNANLIPYNIEEFEVGFDTRLFGSRLSLDVSYYSKKTTNDIVGVSASQTSGYGSAIANVGEITNKGIEFLISGTPIKSEDFTWNTSLNFAYNKGVVVSTNADESPISLGEARSRNVQIRHIPGEDYGVIWGTSYARDDNGTIIYEIDSEGVPRAKNGDYKMLGNGVPPTTLGFSNDFKYKNFNLSFLIDAKFGGQIFSG